MFNYDYEIKRSEGKELRILKPVFSQNCDNLIILEGPNSSGKSTLLNIIALGFYGNKNLNINKSLKHKIESLIGSDHQKLKYNFIIENKDLNIKIECLKESFDAINQTIYEYKEGKKNILSKEKFEQTYRLIYDIPDNPIGRLKELTKDLSETQQRLSNKLILFYNYLSDTAKEISSSKDPIKLKKHQDEIERIKPLVNECEKNRDEIKINYTNLQKYRYLLYYKQLKNDIKQKKKELKEFDLNSKDNINFKKIIEKPNKFLIEAKELKNEIDQIFIVLRPVLKSLRDSVGENYYEFFYKKGIEDILMNSDNHVVIINGIDDYIDTMESKRTELDFNDNQKGKFFCELKDLLGRYIGFKIKLPGLGKDLSDFYDTIIIESNKYESLVKDYDNTRKIIEKLKDLREKVNLFINKFYPEYEKNLKQIENIIPIKDFDNSLERNKERITKEIQFVEDLYNKAQSFLIKLNYDINNIELEVEIQRLAEDSFVKVYDDYDIKSLDKVLVNLKNDFDIKCEEINELSKELSFNQRALNDLEKLEEHKYLKYYQDILEFQSKVLLINKMISNHFSIFIENLKSGNTITIDTESKENQNYYNHLKLFLAKKVNLIRHIDKEYKIKSIDLINDCFNTSDDIIIKLSDMGTGQSQSAFLKGLLNVNDNRKLIVLFDEIAMMDKESLKPIINTLKDLYLKGDLLLAILVQKAEKYNVISLLN